MVTRDVGSLYTNIDHSEGPEALKFYLQQWQEENMTPADFVLSLMEWTLNNNIFLFQEHLYKQEKDTAVGMELC